MNTPNKNWFEVDVAGLRALQRGKPKTFIVRELIQNAWDEDIKNCNLNIFFKPTQNMLIVSVRDDNPEGFKNLRDAYTLFGDTSKRRNAEQRGRFNLGEKQLISICSKATISTTKGTIIFDEHGRRETNDKTEKGTIVEIELDGTLDDSREMTNYAKQLLVPKNIHFTINGLETTPKTPFKTFETILMTEISEGEFLKRTRRKAKVNIIKEDTAQLYEMGIPIMDIDCNFGIDIQQKVPLSYDRDSVNQTFLKELYTEVLNNIYQEISGEDCSSSWIRLAMSGKGVTKEAIQHILDNRYGEKCVIANSFDNKSIDEAIANGYRVIYGNEMSKGEWQNIKEHNLIPNSSDIFGTDFTNTPEITPNKEQKATADYAKRIAKQFLGFDINVSFVKGGHTMVVAQYGDRHLTFNISKLNNGFFNNPISEQTTDLILHELGHEAGHHTEDSYHRLITKLGAQLTMYALKEPKFFHEAI